MLDVGELARCCAALVAREPMVLGACVYCGEERDHVDACPWWRLRRLVGVTERPVQRPFHPPTDARPEVVL